MNVQELIKEYHDRLDGELEDLIFMIGDDAEPSSEDEILNVLIGVVELNKRRYNKIVQNIKSYNE
jgi:hypothetical protein